MSKLTFKEQAEAAYDWWRSLQSIETERGRFPGDRATLARLRRSSSAFEAAAEPATAKLFRKLGGDSPEYQLGRIAVLACVLAHVRENTADRVARAIGRPAGGDESDAIVKPLRLRRLLSSRTDEEVLQQFRRIVALLDRAANIRDLAKLILTWDDSLRGDRARTMFAFDYHSAADAAPPASLTAANTDS